MIGSAREACSQARATARGWPALACVAVCAWAGCSGASAGGSDAGTVGDAGALDDAGDAAIARDGGAPDARPSAAAIELAPSAGSFVVTADDYVVVVPPSGTEAWAVPLTGGAHVPIATGATLGLHASPWSIHDPVSTVVGVLDSASVIDVGALTVWSSSTGAHQLATASGVGVLAADELGGRVMHDDHMVGLLGDIVLSRADGTRATLLETGVNFWGSFPIPGCHPLAQFAGGRFFYRRCPPMTADGELVTIDPDDSVRSLATHVASWKLTDDAAYALVLHLDRSVTWVAVASGESTEVATMAVAAYPVHDVPAQTPPRAVLLDVAGNLKLWSSAGAVPVAHGQRSIAAVSTDGAWVAYTTSCPSLCDLRARSLRNLSAPEVVIDELAEVERPRFARLGNVLLYAVQRELLNASFRAELPGGSPTLLGESLGPSIGEPATGELVYGVRGVSGGISGPGSEDVEVLASDGSRSWLVEGARPDWVVTQDGRHVVFADRTGALYVASR